MREWADKHCEDVDERSIVLTRELLLLMEVWNMAINLDAGDLAAATAYPERLSKRSCCRFWKRPKGLVISQASQATLGATIGGI